MAPKDSRKNRTSLFGRGWLGGGEADDAGDSASQKDAQLSVRSRVSSDVSSLAIETGVLRGATSAVAVTASGGGDLAASGPSVGLYDDAEIMLRVKAGDDSAFDYLVAKYRRAMVSFMYRMAHNSAIAEELAQEVFLRVYRSRENYSADAKFTTWLYRIATNLAVNHARDSKYERPEVTSSIDEADEDTGLKIDVADSSLNAEQTIMRRERLDAIRRHIYALPERQRTAVLMHKYQGMDYRQIAEVLKLSESATKSLLFRAYETLREKLKEFV
ncbi:MAG TPA: sigma-70 family RNA polymerase sigma factor [Terriglobales bacterium]|jgi:RNA polymerase sigma-70 factor (ECF subfamily)|nr:sigma-70 family RNA polymerase sigma factor [Terriglobales bacterium]